MSSNPKRSRQKGQSSISFKAYAARNCAKISARLPFLTKQQIRAKLLNSWRRGCCQDEGSNSKSSSKSRKRSRETKSADPSDNPDSEETSDSNLKQGNELQDTGVVSGLFKSRLKDEITETSPERMEPSATRLLPSEESEGGSNFHAMFSDQDAIFL